MAGHAITATQALSMTPASAGDRLLAGQPHRPIVRIEPARPGVVPPGTVDLWPIEQAVLEDKG